jgi:hypothetical protein
MIVRRDSMNCNRFDEKLFDYMEGEIDKNTGEEMQHHIEVCKRCKEKYEKKLKLRNSLKKACFIERKGLTSVRKYVIREIDKKKYSKRISNKLYYLFFRLREQCKSYFQKKYNI